MTNIAAMNSTKRKQSETQIRNTCSFCWCKSSNNCSRNQLFTGWKGQKVRKKTNDFLQTHTLQKLL